MLDKRKKYIMVLDVETANDMVDPLVYDVGYIIADLHGNIFEQKSVCIHEIFNLRKDLMETAYYANKIPSYYKELWAKERKVSTFYEMRKEMLDLMRKYKVKEVYAYNASFDRNALETTQRYLTKSKYRWFFPYGTKIKCILSMARTTILQQKTFRKQALANNWITPTGKFFTSSAEVAYRYITNDIHFEEEHRGIDDVLIEYEILLKARRQKKAMVQYPNQGLIHKMRIAPPKKKKKKIA